MSIGFGLGNGGVTGGIKEGIVAVSAAVAANASMVLNPPATQVYFVYGWGSGAQNVTTNLPLVDVSIYDVVNSQNYLIVNNGTYQLNFPIVITHDLELRVKNNDSNPQNLVIYAARVI